MAYWISYPSKILRSQYVSVGPFASACVDLFRDLMDTRQEVDIVRNFAGHQVF